jgi:hypothetical protein
MMLVPPERFWRILISRLIFFFFTGCSVVRTYRKDRRIGKRRRGDEETKKGRNGRNGR